MTTPRHFSTLVLATLAAGCGSSVTAVQLRGDAAVDAPIAPTACRWAVSDQPVVVSDPATERRFSLLDAVAADDGAVVAWRERNPNGQDDQVHVRRIRQDGTPHPWSSVGRANRAAVVSLPVGRALQFALVWDGPGDGVAMLAGGPTDRGACVFARFLGDNTPRWQGVDLGALMGFSLAGCGSLARTADGWSFLTGEVRALWGDELVFLSDDGRLAGSPAHLPMTTLPTAQPMTRSAVSDGFVATWVQPAAGTPRVGSELHVRRYDPRGTARGDDQIIGRDMGLQPGAVLETRPGLLAVWGADDGRTGTLLSLALSANGTSAGAPRVIGRTRVPAAIHAAARGAEVLVVTALSPAEPLSLIVTDGLGEPRGEPLPLLRGGSASGVRAPRVVPTARGALIVFEVESGESGGRILAIPVDCLP